MSINYIRVVNKYVKESFLVCISKLEQNYTSQSISKVKLRECIN
ncbi:hypothetical protein [Clostridium perfringens]|nr:hypothetical protein [Clostridium perfringens]